MEEIVEFNKTAEYRMAKENMLQMHPECYRELKATGKLEEALIAKVRSYIQTLHQLRERMPNAQEWERKEIAQAEWLTPVNPNWQDHDE